MSSQIPWQRPPSGHPPPGPVHPPDGPPAEPPPGQPTAPGPVQPMPPEPSPPPPSHAPPPGEPSSKGKTKLIVAIVAALAVMGIASLVVILARGEDEPAPSPQPVGEGTAPRVDVKALIEEQVGPYTLVGTQRNPAAISAGAVEAYVTRYEGRGTQLRHELIAASTEEDALSNQEAVLERLKDEGFAITESQPLVDENDEHVGSLTILVNEREAAEQWVWSRRDLALVLTAVSDRSQVEPFYDAVPY